MSSLKTDIDRGLKLVAEIEKRQEELKEICGRIEARALSCPDEHIPLEDPDLEGRQFIARGTNVQVPVVITSDLLVKSFKSDSKAQAAIDAKACGKLARFFGKETVYKTLIDDAKRFRAAAAEILGATAGAAFVAACTIKDKHGLPKNQVKIAWDRVKPTDD